MKSVLLFLAIVGLLTMLLLCGGFAQSAAGAILFGWIRYAGQSLPRVRYDWPRIGSAAVWVALFTVGLHLLVRWFHRETAGGGWRARSTVITVLLIVVLFGAGTAAVGIVHQVMFLRSGPKVYDYPAYAWQQRPDHVLGVCADLLDRARTRRLPARHILQAEADMSTVWGYPHNQFHLVGVDGPDGVIATLIMYSRDATKAAIDGVYVATVDGKSRIEKSMTPREVLAMLTKPPATRAATTAATRPR